MSGFATLQMPQRRNYMKVRTITIKLPISSRRAGFSTQLWVPWNTLQDSYKTIYLSSSLDSIVISHSFGDK